MVVAYTTVCRADIEPTKKRGFWAELHARQKAQGCAPWIRSFVLVQLIDLQINSHSTLSLWSCLATKTVYIRPLRAPKRLPPCRRTMNPSFLQVAFAHSLVWFLTLQVFLATVSAAKPPGVAAFEPKSEKRSKPDAGAFNPQASM